MSEMDKFFYFIFTAGIVLSIATYISVRLYERWERRKAQRGKPTSAH